MCLRFLFGSTEEEDGAEAQWKLVTAMEVAVSENWRLGDEIRQLRELFWQTRAEVESPQAWASVFVRALLDILTEAQEAKDARSRLVREVEGLEMRVAAFERAVAQHEADPLHARVEALTKDLAEAQEQVGQCRGRANTLEAALAQCKQEVAELEQQIKDLNRIVVEQQEALMGGKK